MKFYCYASDVAIALGDPALNPEGRVVFILDVGEFGLRNFDLAGARTLFGMMSVSKGRARAGADAAALVLGARGGGPAGGPAAAGQPRRLPNKGRPAGASRVPRGAAASQRRQTTRAGEGRWPSRARLESARPPNNRPPPPQAHYVERLSNIYFHNAGALLMQLFRLVSPFIDPVTRSKIIFLPSDPQEAAALLAKDIDVEVGGFLGGRGVTPCHAGFVLA